MDFAELGISFERNTLRILTESLSNRKGFEMSQRLFFFGAVIGLIGLLVMIFVNLGVGMLISCMGGFGATCLGLLCNRNNLGDGWTVRAIWLFLVVSLGLLALSPILVVVGLVLIPG